MDSQLEWPASGARRDPMGWRERAHRRALITSLQACFSTEKCCLLKHISSDLCLHAPRRANRDRESLGTRSCLFGSHRVYVRVCVCVFGLGPSSSCIERLGARVLLFVLCSTSGCPKLINSSVALFDRNQVERLFAGFALEPRRVGQKRLDSRQLT